LNSRNILKDMFEIHLRNILHTDEEDLEWGIFVGFWLTRSLVPVSGHGALISFGDIKEGALCQMSPPLPSALIL
jgi:hypothetical protein